MSFFDDTQNPFSDPSVRNATQSTQPATIDFNPFEKHTTAVTISPQLPSSAPVVTEPQNAYAYSQPGTSGSVMREEAPPAYSVSPAEKIAQEDLDRRQRELDAKAAEIQRREDALARQSASIGIINNWPPLPSFCPLKPCYYQDFDVDINQSYRSLVKLGYYLTLGHFLVYALNTIIGFAFFMVTVSVPCTPAVCGSGGATFGLSLLFLILFAPASYMCWFRPLYKAFKNDSSINFFWFFFVSLGQFIVDIIWALGFTGSGSLGFINGVSMIPLNPIGIVMLIMGCLSALLAFGVAILAARVHHVYRSTGASFEKAKQELATGAFSSNVMRDAVSAGAQAAVTGAATSGTSQQGGSSGNRF